VHLGKNLPRHSDRRECGRLSSTDDRRQLIHFVYHDQRCALLGLDRLELRRLRADLILCYKIIRGLVLFFSRLFAIPGHVVIHLNCFYRIQGLIVDSIFSLFI